MGYGRFAPNNRPKEGEYYYHIFIGCLFSLEKIEEQPTPPPVAPKADAGADTLYRKNSDGKFVPVTADKLPVASPVKKEVSSTPSQKTPALKPPPTLAKSSAMATSDSCIANWNGWPDGEFTCDLTFEEYEKTGNLKVHWAHRVMGGDRTGDLHATSYEKGKRRARKCLGVLDCENPDCEVIVRPHVRPEAIDKQMISGCPKCHSSLTRVTCDNISKIWIYAGGIHYDNGQAHSHGRLPHVLGLLPDEQERFESIVKAHPNAGPLELIHGVATIHGPGESVADISECLINADRVNKEKQKYSRSQGMTGDAFISAFSDFCKKNPGFVIFLHVSDVTVICFQSGFMASQLVKEGILDGPVNGLVSDATHSFFKDREAKLVISSIYSPDLACWVPGIFSYTNGSTIQHYKYHFLALFQSIANESRLRDIAITDEIFAGVRTYFHIFHSVLSLRFTIGT